MHNREHVVLIRPSDGGLVLHTLYYPDELHRTNRSEAPKAKYSAKELELAKSLVKNLAAPFEPQEFKDTYRENVERLIEQKSKGQKITTVKQPRKAPVVDLMEALKRSLKASAPAKKASGRRKVA
jgi:DNA end-binding protein Ku